MFILQGAEYGGECEKIAECNAARFFGQQTAEPGDSVWEELHPSLEYGLGGRRIASDYAEVVRHLPVLLAVRDPEEDDWPGWHAVLVVEADDGRVRLVNYRWETGPTVEWIDWTELAVGTHANAAISVFRAMTAEPSPW